MRGCFIGRTDPPLTTAGRDAAARKLSHLKVEAIYVSPLRRALQTAQAIRCGVEPVVMEELAEIDFGEWEGLTWQQIEQRWPAAACRKIEDWLGATAPGGESWSDFDGRVGRALDRILAGPKPAAVVAHMVVNAALAARLTGVDPKRYYQQYGEIFACEPGSRHSVI